MATLRKTHSHVAGLFVPHLVLDSLLHGSQVDGDVRRVGHQTSILSKHSTGEVKSLLDVRGDGGSLQNSAHLLCRGRQKR